MTTIKIAGVPEHFNLPWHLCIENGEFKAEDIVDYSKQEGLSERVLKKFGAAVGAGALKSILGEVKPALR